MRLQKGSSPNHQQNPLDLPQRHEEQLGQRAVAEGVVGGADVAGAGAGDKRRQAAGQQAVVNHQDRGGRDSGQFGRFLKPVRIGLLADAGDEAEGGEVLGEPLPSPFGRLVG